jgi:hypothetical protein
MAAKMIALACKRGGDSVEDLSKMLVTNGNRGIYVVG